MVQIEGSSGITRAVTLTLFVFVSKFLPPFVIFGIDSKSYLYVQTVDVHAA